MFCPIFCALAAMAMSPQATTPEASNHELNLQFGIGIADSVYRPEAVNYHSSSAVELTNLDSFPALALKLGYGYRWDLLTLRVDTQLSRRQITQSTSTYEVVYQEFPIDLSMGIDVHPFENLPLNLALEIGVGYALYSSTFESDLLDVDDSVAGRGDNTLIPRLELGLAYEITDNHWLGLSYIEQSGRRIQGSMYLITWKTNLLRDII